jgi:hypothetical protein
MTRFLAVLTLGLLLPAAGQADLYVRKTARSTSFVDGVAVGTRRGDATETWIGDGRIASREGNKTILLDLKRDWFCIVNHVERSFVEASLPLAVEKVLAEDLLEEYKDTRTSGKVTRADATREMLSWKCRKYSVLYWDVDEGVRSNERAFSVWATEDVKFDELAYSKMLECMRVLHNRDKKLRNELNKIKGLQTGHEVTSNASGIESRFVTEIAEMAELDPPDGTYAVPEGYRRKERLSDRDF